MKIKTNLQPVWIVILGLTVLFSCKTKEEDMTLTEAPSKNARLYDISEKEQANIQMAMDFVNSLLAGDTATARSMAHEDYYDFGPGAKDSMSLNEFLGAWAATSAARTDQDPGIIASTGLTVNEGNLKGDWVNLWGTYTGKQGDFAFDVPWHRVFFIEEGKIVLSRVWYDRLSIGLERGTYQAVPQE